jgi:hypothetical protein
MARKFRNEEERQTIYDELYQGLESLGIDPSSNIAIKPLIDAIEQFVKDKGGRQFDGTVEVNGLKIEYVLPGRRILRHRVKVFQEPVANTAPKPIVVPRSSLPL